MGYHFIRYLSRFIIAFYYRIQYRNLHKIPKDVPLVILANHTNAFLDSLVLGGRVPQKMYSLPRGTIFFNQSRFVLMTFHWARMIPIYRRIEGGKYLKRNLKSFEFLKEALGKKEGLQIFPEAICIQERRLKPTKKGAAKIMLGAEKKFGYDLNTRIVFLGINYEKAPKFDSELFLNYSRPYGISEFFKSYQENEGRGINEFTKFIGRKIKNQVVHINDSSLDQLVEHAEVIFKSHLFQEHSLDKRKLSHHFILSREIAKAVNYFHDKEDARLSSIGKEMSEYFKQINELGIKDHWVINKVNLLNLFIRIIGLFIALPIHIYGLLTNLLPAGIPKLVAEKVVKKDEFYSSVAVLMAMATYLVIIPIYVIVAGILFNSWVMGVLFALSAIIAGKFSVYYMSWLRTCREMLNAKIIRGIHGLTMLDIVKTRNNIVDNLGELKVSFRNRYKS